jgi:hypothetical protein
LSKFTWYASYKTGLNGVVWVYYQKISSCVFKCYINITWTTLKLTQVIYNIHSKHLIPGHAQDSNSYLKPSTDCCLGSNSKTRLRLLNRVKHCFSLIKKVYFIFPERTMNKFLIPKAYYNYNHCTFVYATAWGLNSFKGLNAWLLKGCNGMPILKWHWK